MTENNVLLPTVDELARSKRASFSDLNVALLDLGERPRSPLGPEFGRAQPSSLYEVEIEAERQEVLRQYQRLESNFDSDLKAIHTAAAADLKVKTKRNLWRAIGLAIIAALAIGVASGLIAAKVAYGKTVEQVVADLSGLIWHDVGTSEIMVASASKPTQPTPPMASGVIEPAKAAPEGIAAGPPAVKRAQEVPVPPEVLARIDAHDSNTLTPSTQTAQPPAAIPVHRADTKIPKTAAEASTNAKDTPSPANALAGTQTARNTDDQNSKPKKPDEQLFAIDEVKPKRSPVAPAPVATVAAAPTAPAPAATIKLPVAETREKPSDGPRRAKYGDGGVVTLLPDALVVFDHVKKSQMLVKAGQKLPDGTAIKSVDPKTGLVQTDRGDVIFD